MARKHAGRGGLASIVLLGWLARGVAACGADAREGGAGSPCEAAADRWRSCGLLSEGEVDCRRFESPSYAECATACLADASCEQMREQACDDRGTSPRFA